MESWASWVTLHLLDGHLSLHNPTLEGAIELALNKPLWRLLAASGATHWWCMANNDDDDDDDRGSPLGTATDQVQYVCRGDGGSQSLCCSDPERRHLWRYLSNLNIGWGLEQISHASCSPRLSRRVYTCSMNWNQQQLNKRCSATYIRQFCQDQDQNFRIFVQNKTKPKTNACYHDQAKTFNFKTNTFFCVTSSSSVKQQHRTWAHIGTIFDNTWESTNQT